MKAEISVQVDGTVFAPRPAERKCGAQLLVILIRIRWQSMQAIQSAPEDDKDKPIFGWCGRECCTRARDRGGQRGA